VTREARTGPAAIPNGQLGERIPSGLRVKGRYRVVNEIGAGAFGTVCVGEDESTGHRVAIRFLPRSFANTPQAAQAVLRMGRSIISASTSHPAMARVLEFGELDVGRPFTVTEFVEGRRLSELMSGGTPLGVNVVLRLALELGGAVETLHNMGFIHGAICPRNVMVLEDGHVKLLDVELAGIRDARESQGLVNASPQAEYLSPEQIQKGLVTEKTDIYAYGIVLYEMLSGTPPFQGSTPDAIFAKHLKDAPIPIYRRRDGVPASVSRAATLALYKQPEARPLMGDVLNLLWTGAHGPAPRRKRAALIVGGAALATLAIVAVIWGVLALLPLGSSSSQPTVREPIPASRPPSAVAPRKPGTPLVANPNDTGRAPVGESSTPSVQAPEMSVAPPVRSAPTVSTPPVERAPLPTRPPAAVAPPAAPPAESRPAPLVRQVTPPPAVSSPAPTAAPPVAPPAPAVAPPARPAPTPPAQTATTPAAPRSERREPTPVQTPPAATAPERPAPSTDSDDSRAVIDWLFKPRSQ
jgi:serine/threonine protein kinase